MRIRIPICFLQLTGYLSLGFCLGPKQIMAEIPFRLAVSIYQSARRLIYQSLSLVPHMGQLGLCFWLSVICMPFAALMSRCTCIYSTFIYKEYVCTVQLSLSGSLIYVYAKPTIFRAPLRNFSWLYTLSKAQVVYFGCVQDYMRNHFTYIPIFRDTDWICS